MALSKFQFEGYKILKSNIELSENISDAQAGLRLRFKTSGIVKKNEH